MINLYVIFTPHPSSPSTTRNGNSKRKRKLQINMVERDWAAFLGIFVVNGRECE